MWKPLLQFSMVSLLMIVLQRSVMWPWLGEHYVIDLVLIVIAVIALVLPLPQALGYGLSLALVMDLANPFIFGTYFASALIIILISQWCSTTWFKQSSILQIITITSLAHLAGLMAWLSFGVIGQLVATSLVNTQILLQPTNVLVSWVILVLSSSSIIYCWRWYAQRSL